MVNKILDQQSETKEEIITQAAGQVYRRVERRMDSDDRGIFYETAENEALDERIQHGCRVFYELIYEDMLGEDPIRLADQRQDILDGCYLVVRQRRHEDDSNGSINDT
jgi:CRISPR type I-D-associated protein Csc3/Cas10d